VKRAWNIIIINVLLEKVSSISDDPKVVCRPLMVCELHSGDLQDNWDYKKLRSRINIHT
jgi:hypothetical protein